jgi:hypothetical protein
MTPEKEIIEEVVKDPSIISWVLGIVSVIFGGVGLFLTKRVIDLPKNYVSKEDFLEHKKNFDASVVRIYDGFGKKVDGINARMDKGFDRLCDKIDEVRK